MNVWQRYVAIFHRAFGHPAPEKPTFDEINALTPDGDETLVELRERLIKEEAKETFDAIRAGDMGEAADGLGDLIYVVVGTAVVLGVDLEPVLKLIQDANMAKLGPDGKPIVRGDGKIMKPEGWTKPDAAIREEVIRQGWTIPLQ